MTRTTQPEAVVTAIVSQIEKSIGRPLRDAELAIVVKTAVPAIAKLEARLAALEVAVDQREQARIAKRQITPAAARMWLEIERRVTKMARDAGLPDRPMSETNPAAYEMLMKAAEPGARPANGSDAHWSKGIL